jgi:hypothetical protein
MSSSFLPPFCDILLIFICLLISFIYPVYTSFSCGRRASFESGARRRAIPTLVRRGGSI